MFIYAQILRNSVFVLRYRENWFGILAQDQTNLSYLVSVYVFLSDWNARLWKVSHGIRYERISLSPNQSVFLLLILHRIRIWDLVNPGIKFTTLCCCNFLSFLGKHIQDKIQRLFTLIVFLYFILKFFLVFLIFFLPSAATVKFLIISIIFVNFVFLLQFIHLW